MSTQDLTDRIRHLELERDKLADDLEERSEELAQLRERLYGSGTTKYDRLEAFEALVADWQRASNHETPASLREEMHRNYEQALADDPVYGEQAQARDHTMPTS